MTSRASSRVAKKNPKRGTTPNRSNLSVTSNYVPQSVQLKSKLDALQDRYSEFMNNCSNLFSEDVTGKKEPHLQVPGEKIAEKQKNHNEFYKENIKLKRKNDLLSKTVNELSTKVVELESKNPDPVVSKEIVDKAENKKKLIEKQDLDIVLLQQELVKAKFEIGTIKNTLKENEQGQYRSFTPSQTSGSRSPYLIFPKPKSNNLIALAKDNHPNPLPNQHARLANKISKINNSKKPLKSSPIVQKTLPKSIFKSISPVARNRSISPSSPISRSLSPKERNAHGMKKELTNLKSELVKTREERDLYKSWKDYCSKHPPVPPAIHTIINHYEIEINKLNAFNSIFKTKSQNLARAVTELLNSLESKGNSKMNRDTLQDLKTNVRIKIKELQEDVLKTVENIEKPAKRSESAKNSYYKLEEENKDLENILKRENLLADMYTEAVKIKSSEINDLKLSINAINTSERYLGNTTSKATESGFDAGSSVASTPYHKNSSFELSFATRDKSSFSCASMNDFADPFEKAVNMALHSISERINHKNDKLSKFQKKLKDTQQKIHFKLLSYKDKVIKQEFFISALQEEIKNEKQISKKNFEDLKNAEKELHMAKEQLKTLENKEFISENQQEVAGLKEKLKIKEHSMENLKENLLKEKECVKRNLDMILGYENELDKMNEDMKRIEIENKKLQENLGKKDKDIESLKEILRTKDKDMENLKEEIEKSSFTVKKPAKTEENIEIKENIEKYRKEIIELNVQVKTIMEENKKYKENEEDYAKDRIKLEKYAEQAQDKDVEIENLKEILKEKVDEIKDLQNIILENSKLCEKLAEEVKKNLPLIEDIDGLNKDLAKKDIIIDELKKVAESIGKYEGLAEKLSNQDSEIKRLIKLTEDKELEVEYLKGKHLEYEEIFRKSKEDLIKCNEELKQVQILKVENLELNALVIKLEERVKVVIEKESEIKQLHKLIEIKDEELKEKEQATETLQKIVAQNKEKIRQLEIFEKNFKELSEKLEANESIAKEKDMKNLEMANKISEFELKFANQHLEISSLKSKNSETTTLLEQSNQEILGLNSLISSQEKDLKSLSYSLKNIHILEQTLDSYTNQITILENAISESNQELVKKNTLISSLLLQVKNFEGASVNQSQLQEKDKNIEDLQNSLQKKEAQIELLKNSLVSSQSALEKLQVSEVELSKLKKEISDKSESYKVIEKLYKDSQEELLKTKQELIKVCEKIDETEKFSIVANENTSKLEDQNEILKEQFVKATQETEEYKKTLEELACTQLSFIQTQEELKNLKSQYEISQMLLKEQELQLKSSEANLPLSQKPDLCYFSSPVLSIPPCSTLNLIFSHYFSKSLTELSISELAKSEQQHKNAVKELSDKNSLLEIAYKKIKNDITAFQESCKEEIEDLKLDKYELAKENDELKKKNSGLIEEYKKLRDEAEKLDAIRKELQNSKTDLEEKIIKIISENEEKSKKILDLTTEFSKLKEYHEKIHKEKENLERELANFIKQQTLGDTGIRAENTALQQKVVFLESSKGLVETKYKKLMKDKEEISEKRDDLIEEVEILKNTRSQQENEIKSLMAHNKKVIQQFEEEKKLTNELKNKLATFMCNANALRSLTPPPVQVLDDDSLLIKSDEEESPQSRFCKTLESDDSSDVSQVSIERALDKLKRLIKNEVPTVVIDWCKQVLGAENYIFWYPDTGSDKSEESKLNVDSISIFSEGNQEVGYRAHAKMVQQKKMIESLIAKGNEKKQRLKVCKNHIKLLQENIRKLDLVIKNQNNFDIEYLRGAVQKFSEKLKGLDADSLVMLQIIYSQLGLSTEHLSSKDSKKKRGIFTKKP